MQRFRNFRTMTKLMLAFAGMGVIMAAVGYTGMSSIATLDSMLETMYDRDLIGISTLKEAEVNLVLEFRAVREAVIYSDAADLQRVRQMFEKSDEQVRANLDKYRKTVILAEAKAKLADLDKAYAEYVGVAKRIIDFGSAGKKTEAMQGLVDARSAAGKALEEFSALAALKEKLGEQAHQEGNAIAAHARTLMIAVMATGMLLALALGYFIARLISRDLAKVKDVTEQAAGGDLTRRVQIDSKDELGEIGRALNGMLDSFHGSMTEVRQASDHTAAASQQLAAGSEQLSSGAQEQASSLEETAASLEQITGTAKQNADNAKQANQLAVGSRDAAEKGGEVVTAAVNAMQEINRASKKIADIITTIDEIAFQTNLLALNAAVEAARAGEQGRGFAVVAAEVRNLAQRSATAAKEIKGLIEDSLGKVEAGSELVNRSGETLSEIVGSVKRVTDIIAEIAAASQEQTTGIDQVNRAVTQMDQVVQSNASQTEELSATAQSLAGQAAELQNLVARFKLESGARTSPASATVPTSPVAPSARALASASHRKFTATPHPRQSRKTDVPVLAAAPATNGKAHHGDDGFEEF